MLKIKKVLSVLLSLLMAFGAFSVAAFAENTALTDISFDFEIAAGMTIDDVVETITINTIGLELDDDNDESPVFVYWASNGESLSPDTAFEDDVLYDVYFYLKPSEGYEFDESIKYVTVNGKKTDNFYLNISDDLNYIGIYFYEFSTNAESVKGQIVEKAEIAIDANIAGTYVNSWDSYVDILTKSLKFEDDYGDPAVFVYDENGDQFLHQFESGETYTFYVYLAPKNGYALADYVEGYLNGEEVSTHTDYWYPGEDYGDVKVDYVEFCFELTVDGEKQLSIFERIINFFRNLFDKLLSIFSFQPAPVK